MLLAYLYESPDESIDSLKAYEAGNNLLFSSTFWLLQLWLNATFEASLPRKGPLDEEAEAIKRGSVEGTMLALLTL